MSKAGRHTKLNKERLDLICRYLRAGNTRKVAAECAGISEQTFYTWINKGKEAKSGVFFEFLESVKKAESEAHAGAVNTITVARQKSWQAAAWWLERKFPDDWGKREKMEVEHKGPVSGFKVEVVKK